MANELDELMSRLDLDPSLATTGDIDLIIAHQRKARANFESGIKPKKGEGSGPKIEASELLSKLNLAPSAPAATIKRRF